MKSGKSNMIELKLKIYDRKLQVKTQDKQNIKKVNWK